MFKIRIEYKETKLGGRKTIFKERETVGGLITLIKQVVFSDLPLIKKLEIEQKD